MWTQGWEPEAGALADATESAETHVELAENRRDGE
jgi:hypothetical protein